MEKNCQISQKNRQNSQKKQILYYMYLYHIALVIILCFIGYKNIEKNSKDDQIKP